MRVLRGLALTLLLTVQGCESRRGTDGRSEVPLPVFVAQDDREAPLPPPAEDPAIAASRVPEFRNCAPCHNVERGAANGVGPNLFGVFGRRAAMDPNYRYSPALRASGLSWDYATLDRYLANPRAVVPATRMVFAGIRNAERRKAVVAFLKIRSPQEKALPVRNPG